MYIEKKMKMVEKGRKEGGKEECSEKVKKKKGRHI